MVTAIATWELHLPGCQSLKDKRGVIRPLTSTRVRVTSPIRGSRMSLASASAST